jgi:hypothetical protein
VKKELVAVYFNERISCKFMPNYLKLLERVESIAPTGKKEIRQIYRISIRRKRRAEKEVLDSAVTMMPSHEEMSIPSNLF